MWNIVELGLSIWIFITYLYPLYKQKQFSMCKKIDQCIYNDLAKIFGNKSFASFCDGNEKFSVGELAMWFARHE